MEIQLKSQLQGVVRGVPCQLQPYQARLVDGCVLQVGQPFSSGEIGWMSGWRLQDLIRTCLHDELYLDFGQDWKVKGMRAVLSEALEHVEFQFKFKEETQR